jgi:hypothetical protein
MEVISFSIDYFKNRVFEKEYELEPTIKKLIDDLNEEIKIPAEALENASLFRVGSDRSLRRTGSSSSRRGLTRSNSKNSSFGNLAEDWEAVRNFKATKIDEKQGLDKHISDMRGLLNKMSVKNYESQKDAIIEALQSILETDIDLNDQTILFENMFSIMCSNSFLSKIYSDLYVELVGIHELFGKMVDDFVESYKSSLNEIHYVDPNTDYDGFCDYNKKNDTRKCHVLFIMNLMKQDMISQESVLVLITDTLALVGRYMKEENRQNEIEELSDNMVLLINETRDTLSSHEKWNNEIVSQIKKFTSLSVKECVSFSSRAKFKFMDCKC